jgi:hypothetical protein
MHFGIKTTIRRNYILEIKIAISAGEKSAELSNKSEYSLKLHFGSYNTQQLFKGIVT